MNTLVSSLAAHIQALLDVKHALGLPYLSSERHLRAFDALCARFCVRRTAPGFWAFSDRMHEAHARAQPVEGGLFDLNRLEDR